MLLLGRLLLRKGANVEAIDHLESYVELAQHDSRGWLLLATAYASDQRYERALHALVEAQKIAAAFRDATSLQRIQELRVAVETARLQPND
jgi:predicted Zn-dependent protease